MSNTINGVDTIVNISPQKSFLLMGIVALGAALRIIVMAFFTGAIDTEGVEYIRIADNLLSGKGYEGIATPGVELMFPPLYPLLIAALSLIVQDFELAARLVCVIFGSVLPISLYYITSRLYDRRTSLLATTVAALHPLLINLSASTCSEGPYITVLLIGTYLAIRCIQGGGINWYISTGTVFGLAYLIRPEAFILPFLLAIFIAVVYRKNFEITWRKTRALFVVFFVMAGPYIAFLYYQTGQLRFEGKTPINFEIGRRLLAGENINDVSFGIEPNLEETGIWMRSNADVIRGADLSPQDIVLFALRAGSINLPDIVKQLSMGTWIGSPLLLFLSILGLFSHPWTREQRQCQLFLLCLCFSSASGLMTIIQISSRYYFFFVPILIIWASYGTVCLWQWAILTVDATSRRGKLIGSTLGTLPMISVIVLPLMTVNDLYIFRVGGPQSRPVKVAGSYLRTIQSGPLTVMDSQTNVAFHAGAKYVPIPHGSAETVLAYAARKEVDFIVLRPSSIMGREVLEEWVRTGIKHKQAELVYTSPSTHPEESLLIYRWKHTDSRGST